MAGFTRYWSGWHNYVGIVFFATATLGLVLLARLPRSRQALQQRNSRYPSFMALHWLLGIATLATAVVSVYSGVHQYHQQFGDHVKGYYVFLSAYLGIVLFVFGILELYSSLARLSCLAWLCPRLRGKKAPQSNTLLVEAGQNVDALPTIVSLFSAATSANRARKARSSQQRRCELVPVERSAAGIAKKPDDRLAPTFAVNFFGEGA
eukprot:jgi/Chlat1/3408/Chrsp23S03817